MKKPIALWTQRLISILSRVSISFSFRFEYPQMAQMFADLVEACIKGYEHISCLLE